MSSHEIILNEISIPRINTLHLKIPSSLDHQDDQSLPGSSSDLEQCDESTQPDQDQDGCSDAGSDAGSDYKSETSTVEWDHESYETFRFKVSDLACNRIWPGAIVDEVFVERLRGGTFNRVIGISRLPKQDFGKEEKLILRIPREEQPDFGIDADVAAIQFVRKHTTIPVPETVAFDETNDNEIGAPHMIQRRLEGFDAYSQYRSLNHSQKCDFALELGFALRQMLAVRSSTTGKLRLPPNNRTLDAQIRITPSKMWNNDMEDDDEAAILAAPTFVAGTPHQSACQLLVSLFARQEKIQLVRNLTRTTNWEGWPWTEFIEVATEMDSKGYLGGTNALAHLDCEPHNILVNPHASGDEPVLTAILDWDSAVIGPAFVACKPPQWIWGWDDNGEDERKANDTPESPEDQELKQLFELAAGKTFLRFAYGSHNRIARRLFKFAREDVTNNQDIEDAKALIKEWAMLRLT